MAKMVFGEWRGDGTGTRGTITHFATERTERDYRTACNRELSIVHVFSGFAVADEGERRRKGERATSCKACRRAMGWVVNINGKIINDTKARR